MADTNRQDDTTCAALVEGPQSTGFLFLEFATQQIKTSHTRYTTEAYSTTENPDARYRILACHGIHTRTVREEKNESDSI
jgi:hypothetical protein